MSVKLINEGESNSSKCETDTSLNCLLLTTVPAPQSHVRKIKYSLNIAPDYDNAGVFKGVTITNNTKYTQTVNLSFFFKDSNGVLVTDLVISGQQVKSDVAYKRTFSFSSEEVKKIKTLFVRVENLYYPEQIEKVPFHKPTKLKR